MPQVSRLIGSWLEGWLPVAAASLALVFAACGDDEAGSTSARGTAEGTKASGSPVASTFPITVKDYGGVDVTVRARPVRIVSYSPGATEALFAMGAGGQVVAVDRFSNFPQQANALPKVEYSNPSPEAALAHQPDLVIFATRQLDQTEPFRAAGMTVLYTASAESLAQVYEQIEMLGKVTGHESEARQVVSSMRTRIDGVTSKLAEVQRGPRVFYEVTKDLYTVAPNSFAGGLLTALKAQNVAAGAATQFPQLSSEAVVSADPEVILLSDPGESLETVRARPGWDLVSAVVNSRVVALDPDAASRPGPRLAESMEVMAKALYPERFR